MPRLYLKWMASNFAMETTWDKTRINRWAVVLLFLLALGYNLWGVSYHFTMGFLAGHEFRQSQTAIISYYIDKESNFGLLYEVPVLGKPWVSILLEVPIYEWSVVGLSRLTGWEHVVAARTISVTCFYATLGATWLLLGLLGVARPRRLLFLALILATPVYIFYSRAFLMDSMALMGSVWWLYAFVRVMQDRSWLWLLIAVVMGSLSALVKGAVYAVWLVPGAAYGVWVLWRDIKHRLGCRQVIQTIAWGLGTVAVPLGLLEAWLLYTDPIKAAHASAWIFTSKNLSLGNWGMLSPQALLSAEIWRYLLNCWDQAILSRWLLVSVLVLGLFIKRARWQVGGIGGMFFLAQFMMPYAFAYQDYYYYICALFAVVAVGWVASTLIDQRKRSWAGLMLACVLIAAQVRAYKSDYYIQQSAVSNGGYAFTDVIRDMTPKNSIIVVAGADWAAMTPLYAERRALMVRNGLEYDEEYLDRAFDEIDDELVSAIIVWNKVRYYNDFLQQAAQKLRFDVKEPTFSWADSVDVYINPFYVRPVQTRLLHSNRYPGVTLPESASKISLQDKLVSLSPGEAAAEFSQFSPLPYQISFDLGVDWMDTGGRSVLSAHPDMNIWLKAPRDAKRIEWTFGMFDSAYLKEGGKSDGVIFMIIGETPRGESRILYERLLDPLHDMNDRGDQHEIIEYNPLPDESLRFATRGNQSRAYDWAYIYQIKVE